MRYMVLILQLLIVAAAVWGAQAIDVARRFDLPDAFPRVTLDGGQLLRVMLCYVACHVALIVPSWFIRSATRPTRPRWWIVESVIALSAAALATGCAYTLLASEFDPVLHLVVFALLGGAYGVGAIAAWVLSPKGTQPVAPDDGGATGDDVEAAKPATRAWSRRDWGHGFHALSSRWMLAAIVVLTLPWVLLYATIDSRVGDPIDYILDVKNTPPPASWQLVDVFPGVRFEQPLDIAFPPTDPGAMYLLGRVGQLSRVAMGGSDHGDVEVLLDIRDQLVEIGNELGALSFAPHPRFGEKGAPQRGFVYVLLAYSLGTEQYTELARFDLSATDLASRAASKTLLMKLRRPDNPMHTGGCVRFGPDGMLYFSIGDFTVAWSQRVDRTLSGGIFRIDVDQRGGAVSAPIRRQPAKGHTQHYFIPLDNPFYGRADTLEEYYALGLRQPYRMSFDEVTGELWVGDVGEDRWEEITRLRAGANCMWPGIEGVDPWAGAPPAPERRVGRDTPPVFVYGHGRAGKSVVGGFVYRGERHPTLYGQYLYADFASSLLFALDMSQDPPQSTPLACAAWRMTEGVSHVAPGPGGEVYATFFGTIGEVDGHVLRLEPLGEGLPVSAPVVAEKTADQAAASKFSLICARCHGQDGKGLPSLTVGMAPRPDFTSAQWQGSVTDAHIRKAIVEGGLAVGKSKDMPPWGAFLEGEELDAMVRMIRALGVDSEPPDARE